MSDHDRLLEFASRHLKTLVASAAESLDPDFDGKLPFGELGIDSFRTLRIVKLLEQDFGRLPKTLLFECYNVDDLAEYFVEHHAERLGAMAAANISETPASDMPIVAEAVIDLESSIARPSPIESPQPTAVAVPPTMPVLGFEHMLREDPEIGEWVRRTFNDHRNDGSVSRGTRNIAPNLFIGAARLGYFHYARSQDRILAYAYTGPDDHFSALAIEFCRHCIEQGLHPNLLSPLPIPEADELRFSATPFGVVQRIVNLSDFSLGGGDMRRLRYLVSKFEKEGDCRTEEYRCGSDAATTGEIIEIIDKWCANRTMVNPLIYKVREEIATGTLDPAHRLFVTRVNGAMQNVIMISPLAARQNGYLMDLEFYGVDMPLGGLEFAITRMAQTLIGEGCDVLSLGGTHGCKIEESPHADPQIDRVLDELRERNLFNDAGNLQFKNKFRPENGTIYLCRPEGTGDPQDVIDLIMMIADPDRMQTSDAERHTSRSMSEVLPVAAPAVETRVVAIEAAAVEKVAIEVAMPIAKPGVDSGAVGVRGIERSYVLADAGFNPLNLKADKVEFDLKTDSWAQLRTSEIERRMRDLHARLHAAGDPEAALTALFGLPHVNLSRSGRTAERALYRAWPRRGTVLQNLLFPTNLFHQIDNGFTPREIAMPSAFRLDLAADDRGMLDMDALRDALSGSDRGASDGIAMVMVEVANNATGGQPVSLEHLRALAEVLAPHRIPLVVDATRILDNVGLRPSGDAESAWRAVRDLLAPADVVIASLPKNFGVAAGGLIAVRDPDLHTRLCTVIHEDGSRLGTFDRRLLALALQDRPYLEHRIIERREAVARLAGALKKAGVPVVSPVGAHCVLIDIAAIPQFAALSQPIASFLAWLYIETGIRAAGHNAGMSRQSALAGTVRLALALGSTHDDGDEIARRVAAAFATMRNVPDLAPSPQTNVGDLNAVHALQGYRNPSAAVEPRAVASTEEAPVAAVASARVNAPVMASESKRGSERGFDIAIVGMSGRYPGASDPQGLWRLLRDGRDCVVELPESRQALRSAEVAPARYRGGFIDDVDAFDAAFFGISERDAAIMDPQERQFLEVACAAVEDAGYCVESLGGAHGERDIGVFVGAVWTSYQMVGRDETAAGRPTNPSSFLWSIANRVSYWMDLHGPSLTLDTACSASLTALKLACDAIRSGECRAAIVGGVNLDLHQSKYDINATGGALSRTGVCRAYGQGADGYVSGEGVAALVLKPLEQAIADGDQVHGVIRSAVVTHSGRTSAYTVPNPRTQADLITRALTQAGVDARTIGYVEGHGTGTDLGDTIEVAGLARAFAAHQVPAGSCPIGSIKTNIGHLEAASGIVGIQKILLQLRHRALVPSLHAETPNENIDFDTTPFRIQRELSPWDERIVDGQRHPRRACISAIGIGGSNAHVILEEYVPALPQREAAADAAPRVIALAARTPEALRETASRLRAALLEGGEALQIDDIAFTLALGRRTFDHRVALLAADTASLADRLSAFLAAAHNDDVMVGHAGNARGVTAMLDPQERDDLVALALKRGDPRRLAKLWVDGVIADAHALAPVGGRRVSLPTYPFERKRFWIAQNHIAHKDVGHNDVAHQGMDKNLSMPVLDREDIAPESALATPALPRMRYQFWSEPEDGHHAAQDAQATVACAELFVRQTLADCLNADVDTLRGEDGLLDIGLTSQDMAGLTTALKARFGSSFSPTVFFECRTIGDLAKQLAGHYATYFNALRVARIEAEGLTEIALNRSSRMGADAASGEAHLLDAASALDLPSMPWPEHRTCPEQPLILLTGATGFLGIHILHELCAVEPPLRVRCLVRAADVEAAWARLRQQAKRYDLTLVEDRVEVLCGDVCAPQLGLDDARWDACSDEIDQIVHAAAHVNHIEGYASFRDATLGMKEIISLAARRRPKLVQFMSSTAACILKTDDNFAVFEHEAFNEDGSTVYGGYGQSKWVQETLLRRAAEVGVPYAIYRFGELSGSSRTGLAQTHDMLHRLLQMRLAVDCREKTTGDVLDALPVDVAARLVAGTVRTPALWNVILHGTHTQPCPIARVYRMAEQRLGVRYAPVTRQAYLDACMAFVRHVYTHSPLDGFVLECVLRDAEGSSRQRKIIDGYFAVLFPFEQSQFARALDTLGVRLPAWERLLNVYFDQWCSESGYLTLARTYQRSNELANEVGSDADTVGVAWLNRVEMEHGAMKQALERVDGL
jgi:thioester reductase-like protein